MHPDHNKHLPRINRVIGQLEGIKKMIDKKRYCPDIMVQLKAVSSAVKSVETQILKTHLEHCIKDVFNHNNKLDQKNKINELLNLFKK
jgi:DNA-binding FrmR family transcriptional regulator